jgi:hypothetical protein
MNSPLILSIQGVWYTSDGEGWAASSEPPALPPKGCILSDFGNAPCGVTAVDTQPDFAAAVIEKKLRTEGLVDGEAHVLTHRILRAGGGSRVLYTAVPVATWQSTFTWLERQQSVGLLFSVESALLALSQQHDAVLCRIGRQFRFLASKSDALIFLSVTAFSDDPDDVETALQNLAEQVRNQWAPRHERMSLLWCDLVAPAEDDGDRFHELIQQRLGVRVVLAPSIPMVGLANELRTAAPMMVQALNWRAATNPWMDRIAAAADQFSLPITIITAAFGAGLMLVAGFWFTQTLQLQGQAAQMRDEVATITARSAGLDVPPATLLARHGETLGFLGTLVEAQSSPDLLGFIDVLRKASDQRVRVMRVRVLPSEGSAASFQVDGVPLNIALPEQSLSGFLGALRGEGYQAKSEDPGYQTQQPGFFSYSVRRVDLAPGGPL